jgi:hypothetical protein
MLPRVCWSLIIIAAVSAGSDSLLAAKAWVSFTDITSESGVTSETVYGGIERQKYILETTGTGVAIFDYDGDELPDLFLVNGTRLELPADRAPGDRLYRNLGEGRFKEVTRETGISSRGWGQAACIGDVDNDGWTDLLVTYYGAIRLYRNRGDGSFAEQSREARLDGTGRWNAGCAFVDYDNDGFLDLFIAHYVNYGDATRYEPGSGANCKWKDLAVMCGPMGLQGEPNALYRNNGDGTFTDVSKPSGVTEALGSYCLMPATIDFDEDGWTDIFVACDSTPNILYRNKRDGTFTDVSLEAAVAYNENGQEQASMGVAAGDYNSDGHLDVLVTNFSEDTPTLYGNLGDGTFSDATYAAGLGIQTKYLSWGVGLVDLDNDGWQDLFIASGHVYPEVDRHPSEISYRQARQVYRNLGSGRFEDMSGKTGAAIAEAKASRGAAFEDLDGDGDLEIIVVNLNDRPSILRNDGQQQGNWLRVRLEGERSNRSGIGARIRVTGNGRTRIEEVRSASSYYSSNGLWAHFGLGSASQLDRLEVLWPGGARQSFEGLKANQTLVIHETKGILSEAE